MTPTLQRSRALCAALLLLVSVSCGPKVVVARLATPTPDASREAATATATPGRRLAKATPAPASPAPLAASDGDGKADLDLAADFDPDLAAEPDSDPDFNSRTRRRGTSSDSNVHTFAAKDADRAGGACASLCSGHRDTDAVPPEPLARRDSDPDPHSSADQHKHSGASGRAACHAGSLPHRGEGVRARSGLSPGDGFLGRGLGLPRRRRKGCRRRDSAVSRGRG